jgi:hypothetical protein
LVPSTGVVTECDGPSLTRSRSPCELLDGDIPGLEVDLAPWFEYSTFLTTIKSNAIKTRIATVVLLDHLLRETLSSFIYVNIWIFIKFM